MKISRATASALLIAVSLQGSGLQAATLEEVITQTLTNNPQAQATLNRYQASNEAVQVARGGYMPTVDFRSSIGKEKFQKDYSAFGAETDFTPTENSLVLNQNLFDGMSTINEYHRTKKVRDSRKEQLRAKAEFLALNVSDVYLKVLDGRKQVELAKENLKTHERIYDLVQQRSSKGVTNQSDLYQIEGRLARSRANFLTTQNNLQDAESQYMRIVNQLPVDLNMPFLDDEFLPAALSEAIKMATQEHPAIIASIYEVNASQFSYDGTRGKFLPSLDLTVSQRWDKDINGVKGKEDDTTAMLTMRYNFFNGGADMARRQEAAYKVEESKANQMDAHQAVLERLKIAWASMEYITEELPHLKRHMDSSAKTVAAYRQQFEIGKRTLLDVLDSENENYQTKRAYTNANYRALYARYRVLNGMGQMLHKLNIRMPSNWES
ncbi:hypothetical protein ACH42_11320 [Endozoicomonas sp. (ex Bugula neritina AB1)]|nr:hypothetical protein ACH42_11320 [Endozoicomonas sp. (ex Bugula neritina AB1)]